MNEEDCKTVKLKEFDELRMFAVSRILPLEDAVDAILDVLEQTVKLDRESFNAMCKAKTDSRIKHIKSIMEKQRSE